MNRTDASVAQAVHVDRAMSMLLAGDRPGRHRVLRAALSTAMKVRDVAPQDLRGELAAVDPARLVDLAVTLAALVDVDRSPSQLLAWLRPVAQPGEEPAAAPSGPRLSGGRQLVPCPSRAAWLRHKANGEEPCEGCDAENRRYMRERKREKRGIILPPGTPLLRNEALCGGLSAKRRHTRRRERCDTCWPAGSRMPRWYPPEEVPAA